MLRCCPDPLAGVEQFHLKYLQGRIGIGNDLSEMAYVVSKAKLENLPKKM